MRASAKAQVEGRIRYEENCARPDEKMVMAEIESIAERLEMAAQRLRSARG